MNFVKILITGSFYMLIFYSSVNTILAQTENYSNFKDRVDLLYREYSKNVRLQFIDSLILGLHEDSILHRAFLMHKKGVVLYTLGQIPAAIEITGSAVSLRKSHKAHLKDIKQSLHNIGYFFQQLGNYRKALEEYSRILLINEAHATDYNTLYQMAACSRLIGDYSLALEYIERAKSVSDKFGLNKNWECNYLKLNIFQDDPDFSLNELDQLSEELLGVQFSNPLHELSVRNIIGYIYKETGRYNSAKKHYSKSLDILQGSKDVFNPTHETSIDGATSYQLHLAVVLVNMAQVEIDLSNNSTAKEYLTKAISILESKDGELPFLRNLAIAHAVMAKMYFNEGEFVNCLEARAKCLSILTGSTNFSIADDSIPDVVLDQSLLVELLIEFITEMSAPTSNTNGAFQDSFDHFARLFDESIDLLVGGHQSDQSKLTWRNYVKDGYFKLSDTYLNSDRLKEAFHFAEKSRALLLYDKVVAQIDNNDQSELKQLLLKTEVDWFFERDTTIKASHRRKLDSLNDLFRESNYSKLKPNASRSYDYGDLKKFQANLDIDQTAIYFITNNLKTWILKVNRDTVLTNFVKFKESDIEEYNSYLERLRSYSSNKSALENPEIISSFTDQIHSTSINDDILIITDGIWNYLPFESIVIGDIHLISRNSLSYHYSASLSYLDRQESKSTRILALAPFSNFQFKGARNGLSFDQLANSRKEIAGIMSWFDTDTLIGNSANLEQIENRQGDITILHLATHAFGDGSSGMSSYMVLANNDSIQIISHEQIENANLPLEMTVLSACETGLGQLNKGEGLMSLARGFFAAGSKSVITSLWKADDESTYKIMTSFYKYLARGQRKDEALRNAKLEYLENCDPLKSSPFFWAAFIPIGDMSPIRPVPWHLRWWFWPGIILLLGGLTGYGYRRNQIRQAA